MTVETSVSGDSSDSKPNQLKQTLGAGFAVAAGVGTVIGLGIMRTPGEIAAVFPEPAIYVGLWLVVGLFVLLNILVVAELVGMTPRSGGYYVPVRRALGPYPGFLMGWIDWLSFLGTVALKSVVMAEYIILLFPALDSWNKVIAVMAGVLILRRKEPDTPRPYLAWAHPYSTWFCIAVWLLITGFTAYTAPQSAISAIIMTSISIPVYLLLFSEQAVAEK